jgi:hypothetical protein
VRCGLLIYTATAGIQGTLGGLVEVAVRFRHVLRSALEHLLVCSGDPICADHDPTNTAAPRAWPAPSKQHSRSHLVNWDWWEADAVDAGKRQRLSRRRRVTFALAMIAAKAAAASTEPYLSIV